MRLTHVGQEHVVKSDEIGPLRRYDLRGENWDRRLSFTMVVFARSAGSATKYATDFRRDNNLVVAHKWTTKPAV